MNRVYVLKSQRPQIAPNIVDGNETKGDGGVRDHGCLDVDLATDTE